MHCISKYTVNGIFSMILKFNQPTILMKPKNLQLLYISILKNKKASGHSHILLTSFAHARHGSIAPGRTRTCWFVTGQWLHVEPTCVPCLLHCGLHCCFGKLFATYTWHCQTWPSICFVLTFGEHVHRNMKHQCSMRRLTITSGSEKDVRVSRGMDFPFVVIKYHVSANNKNLYVAWLMYISSCSIRSWNWNRKLTQDHFLIEHWIQRTQRCPAARCWPWVYSLVPVSRYSTVRSETLTWREWGLWHNAPNACFL